jgi:S1-C subfamily serine protease
MIRQYRLGAQVELTLLREGQESKLQVALETSPQTAHELTRYRNDDFDFMARDLAFEDRKQAQFPASEQGVYVEGVSEGGWAALAHLAVGDLILDVDGKLTLNAAALEAQMKRVAAEKPKYVVLHVKRGIHDLFIELLPKWAL